MVNYFPENLDEALKIRLKEKVRIMAGGTDLMVRYRSTAGILPQFEEPLLFVNQLKEMEGIHLEGDVLTIGAAATLGQIAACEKTPPIFRNILLSMASCAIRNEGTLAGNIMNASPAGDSLPFLYAVDTVLRVRSLTAEREIPLVDFITGPGKTVLKDDEILTEIAFKIPDVTVHKYKKVGGRRSDAISKLSFLGMARVEEAEIKELTLTFGSVAALIVRNKKLESELMKALNSGSEESVRRVVKDYSELIRPIDDQRSNAKYRKQCSLNLLEGFIGMLK